MKQLFVISSLLLSFLYGSSSLNGSQISSEKELQNKDDFCRVSCTITVNDGNGGSVQITAYAGNMFTSCETAGERACTKAGENALRVASDML